MPGVGIGSMVLPPLSQWFINVYGWHTAYFVLGAPVFALGIPLTAMFVRERPHKSSQSHPVRAGATVAEAVRSPPFRVLTGMLFLSSISVNGAITHLSPLLTDRGVTSSGAALAVSVLGLCSFAGRLMTGYFLDRFFGPRVSLCVLAAVAGILLLATAGSARASAARPASLRTC